MDFLLLGALVFIFFNIFKKTISRAGKLWLIFLFAYFALFIFSNLYVALLILLYSFFYYYRIGQLNYRLKDMGKVYDYGLFNKLTIKQNYEVSYPLFAFLFFSIILYILQIDYYYFGPIFVLLFFITSLLMRYLKLDIFQDKRNAPTGVFVKLCEVLKEKKIDYRGVVHVGGHVGQEVSLYKEIGFKEILIIEPNPRLIAHLKTLGVRVENVAASDKRGKTKLYLTVYDQASSILKPLSHGVEKTVMVKKERLDNIIRENERSLYNVLAIDVQGAELEVLKGSRLSDFDIVICETSAVVRYEGAPSDDDVKRYMKKNNFYIEKTISHGDHGIYDHIFLKND